MYILELLKSVVFGIVEGISEWLPISSTGHMILLESILPLNVSETFMSLYLVVIQLGAIVAVLKLYWNKLWPLEKDRRYGKIYLKMDVILLWRNIIVSCIPAIFVGLFLDDLSEKLFYNYVCVAIALIVFGILFIFFENRNARRHVRPTITSLEKIDYKTALFLGLFQIVAAIFPGVSRSGATIIGGLNLGVSRKTLAEYTFLLSVPVMIGASVLKIFKIGFSFTFGEFIILLVGMIVAYIVSTFVIKFFLSYIRKHDFKAFGWYRIILGVIVLVFSAVVK